MIFEVSIITYTLCEIIDNYKTILLREYRITIKLSLNINLYRN